ncbi:hypothetical protein [Clostridium sp.]|uniref:hypothetical protein n=1 Tax=Clostridium sp. TaxID=1506 RepID=UPI0032169FAE
MFNWDKFKNEKVAVWCDTEEKAREFVKECYERGVKWRTSYKYTTHWYGENTCYIYNFNKDDKLTCCDKPFFESSDIKIIKWESENMKFKVGDKVIPSKDTQWSEKTKYRTIIEIVKNKGYKLSPYEGVITSCVWHDNELKLYEGPTEFTFQEVIARIKEGETYVCTNFACNAQEIRRDKEGKIVLKILSQSMHIKDEVHIPLGIKFKLQEPKKQVTIYKVEHKQNGKKYDFISSQALQEGMFVVCDTSQGKSYGRIVDIEVKELTEKEIKEYRECWRA